MEDICKRYRSLNISYFCRFLHFLSPKVLHISIPIMLLLFLLCCILLLYHEEDLQNMWPQTYFHLFRWMNLVQTFHHHGNFLHIYLHFYMCTLPNPPWDYISIILGMNPHFCKIQFRTHVSSHYPILPNKSPLSHNRKSLIMLSARIFLHSIHNFWNQNTP